MTSKMTIEEMRAFVTTGTRTGHLATTRADGRPHVAPLWFVMDDGDIVFTTWHTSVKGRNLQRSGYAALSVDDPHPPYAFVMVEGPVTVVDDPAQARERAEAISRRYMGADRAAEFGRRNGVAGELVCRLTPAHWTGMQDMAA